MHMLLGWPAATKIRFWGFTGSVGSVLKSGLLPSLLIGFRGSCLLTSLEKKGKFHVHTNLNFWRHDRERGAGGRESSHVTFTKTVDKDRPVMAKKPHWSLLQDELMKTLCIYISPHYLFIYIFFLNLQYQIRVRKCSFSYGIKTPACLVLTFPA